MRELWRRSIALLRNHPVLWMPYLCAAILATGLTMLRRIADEGILHWRFIGRTTSHSILSPDLVETHFDEAAFMRTAERIHFVVRWGIRYIDDCLYAIAIILTALLLNWMLIEHRQRLREVFFGLRSYPVRILAYAAKGWLLSLCLFVFVSTPVTKVAEKFVLSNRSAFYAMYYCADLLWALCFAWVMAPIAIRLLRPVGAAPITAEEKRLGRYTYFFIQAAAFAFSHLVDSWLVKLPLQSSAERMALDASAIATNLPFVLLYVAFALVARPVLLQSGAEKPSTIYAFLKTLMPLHFSRQDEQR
jgi:hypothetical protein